ncbi:hypothetical protein JTB14_030545 [Gonioctena quinquepunctata]|nr:hypothetical protein JTB14_030545 [Gonioctena quinquepunctata]
MNAALEAVARGLPVATAAKIPSVPRVTLMYKSSGRLPTECRMGPSTVLTTNEEDLLEKWILSLAKVYHPVNKEQLLDSPKGDKVLTKKGNKSVYNAGTNDEKENLTVLVTANAAGELGPPMIIFKYERIPGHIALSVNKNWGIGRSESGWMCGSTFYGYIFEA